MINSNINKIMFLNRNIQIMIWKFIKLLNNQKEKEKNLPIVSLNQVKIALVILYKMLVG